MRHLNKFNEGRKQTPERRAENRRKADSKRSQINEIKDKISEFDREFDIIYNNIFDWKEIGNNVVNDWQKTIESIGGYFYDNPSCAASDNYGIIISRKPISKADLIKRAKLEDELLELE